MNETQREQIKGALLKCAEENENKSTFTGYVVVSSVCKSAAERIEELEKQLEAEKKLNEEIKVRFVKCNTCTDEMKSKCLMFSENLCEGNRCEELVDLIELMNKSDLQRENTELKEQTEEMKNKCSTLLDKLYLSGLKPNQIALVERMQDILGV